jgi:hypothetical protein
MGSGQSQAWAGMSASASCEEGCRRAMAVVGCGLWNSVGGPPGRDGIDDRTLDARRCGHPLEPRPLGDAEAGRHRVVKDRYPVQRSPMTASDGYTRSSLCVPTWGHARQRSALQQGHLRSDASQFVGRVHAADVAVNDDELRTSHRQIGCSFAPGEELSAALLIQRGAFDNFLTCFMMPSKHTDK